MATVMFDNNVNSVGLFLSASINRQIFATSIYQAYLLDESINACNEYQSKIQEAIEANKNVDYIETLIKESDYYDSLLNFALAVTVPDDQPQ
jgi:hypothetical protein